MRALQGSTPQNPLKYRCTKCHRCHTVQGGKPSLQLQTFESCFPRVLDGRRGSGGAASHLKEAMELGRSRKGRREGQFRSSVQKVSRGYPAWRCATGSSWEDRRAREPSGRRRTGPLVSAAVATQREGGKAGPDQGGLGANTVAFPWRYRYAGWGSGQCPVSTGRVSSDLPGRGRPQDRSQGKERILRPLWLLPV